MPEKLIFDFYGEDLYYIIFPLSCYNVLSFVLKDASDEGKKSKKI